ncbi:unnamed protein product [Urochloa humidicola]
MATNGPSRSEAAEDKGDPARPLALPSPTVHPASAHDAEEEEAAQTATGWRSTQYLRKRRRCVLCCCGCCVTTAVIVGVIVLVLALTVFKVKDPRLTMNNVWLTAISSGPGSGGIASPVATNATIVADVSIKNPNAAAFKFSRSETDVYYKGQTVSVAYAPAGTARAHRTLRMNVTVDLLADRLTRVMNGTGLVFGQEYDIDTYTEINGRVNVLGIVKKHVGIKLNCSIVIEVPGIATLQNGAASTVQSKGVDCIAHVSL